MEIFNKLKLFQKGLNKNSKAPSEKKIAGFSMNVKYIIN